MDVTTKTTGTALYPGSLWNWITAFAMMPFFCIIGLAVLEGVPNASDYAAWGLLIFLTFMEPLSVCAAVLIWRCTQRWGTPGWLRDDRMKAVGQSVWISAIFGYALMENSVAVSPGIGGWLLMWLILIVPTFVYFLLMDVLISAVGHLWRQRKTVSPKAKSP